MASVWRTAMTDTIGILLTPSAATSAPTRVIGEQVRFVKCGAQCD